MDTVDLGAARLHVVTALPGLPGDADRVVREVASLDPAVVLVDLDTDECLRLLEWLGRSSKPFAMSYVDGLLQDEMARRFAPGERAAEHPVIAAARDARRKHRSFIPMRPITPDPGWLARRRGRAAARGIAEGSKPREFADAFARALAEAKAWRAAADVGAAHQRVQRALEDGRAPVVALVQAHRATAFLASLTTMGRVPA